MTDDTECCMAFACGRRHGITSFISAFSENEFCAFHAGKLEAGEGVMTCDGDTAYYDETHGLYMVPPPRGPRTPPPPTQDAEGDAT